MRLEDSEPLIGIFQYVDNRLFSLVEPVTGQRDVRGYFDASNLFHLDLLKQIANVKTIAPALAQKLRTATTPYEWPRGRVCYDMTADVYEVFGPAEIMNDSAKRKELVNKFNLPLAKTKFYIDPMYQFS